MSVLVLLPGYDNKNDIIYAALLDDEPRIVVHVEGAAVGEQSVAEALLLHIADVVLIKGQIVFIRYLNDAIFIKQCVGILVQDDLAVIYHIYVVTQPLKV